MSRETNNIYKMENKNMGNIHKKLYNACNTASGVKKASKVKGMPFNPLLHDDVQRVAMAALLENGLYPTCNYITDVTDKFVVVTCTMKITDVASVIAPKAKIKIVGVRPGEKIHEQMIGPEDAQFTYEYLKYFKILPQINKWSKDGRRIKNGVKVSKNFTYASDTNSAWLTKNELKKWIALNKNYINKV